MTPGEEWDAWLERARREMYPMLRDSAVYLGLCPDGSGDPDPKWCVELGAAIMYDKPLLVVALAGRAVPPGLARVAHVILEVDDLQSEEAHGLIGEAVERMAAEAARRENAGGES